MRKKFPPGRWITLTKEEFLTTPMEFAGVYMAVDVDSFKRVFYIGQSSNITQRFSPGFNEDFERGLKRKKVKWVMRVWKEPKKFDRLSKEAQLIDRYKPEFNKQFNPVEGTNVIYVGKDQKLKNKKGVIVRRGRKYDFVVNIEGKYWYCDLHEVDKIGKKKEKKTIMA